VHRVRYPASLSLDIWIDTSGEWIWGTNRRIYRNWDRTAWRIRRNSGWIGRNGGRRGVRRKILNKRGDGYFSTMASHGRKL
jgi:hypothetical protein